MKQEILKQARRKFRQLSKNYHGFINVIIDNWRGYRFIFDTKDVRKCNNQCSSCKLFLLLKDEKNKLFSAGLYSASKKDKKLFGPQNFLNCKTIKQYQKCYVNYLIKQAMTRREVLEELKLIKNLKFIYCQDGNLEEAEKKFKTAISQDILALAGSSKKDCQTF